MSTFYHVFWTLWCGGTNMNALWTLRCQWIFAFSHIRNMHMCVLVHTNSCVSVHEWSLSGCIFGFVGEGSLQNWTWIFFWQEVPGMGFHITQPGSSVATSLIDGESKPKHVLLLEIKVAHKSMLDVFFQKAASFHPFYFQTELDTDRVLCRGINIVQPRFLWRQWGLLSTHRWFSVYLFVYIILKAN